MVDTDWKEILSFSQRELNLSDKEKLSESLCWMEADDIELNFTDLKTLFRLAQDILKLKTEQVNNLLGQIETSQRKTGKTKVKSNTESPTQSNDSALETITHQEEIIRANKEILEQLYVDIAEIEGRKSKLEENRSNMDIDSESSRDVLSEMNAIAELEREITIKNKHIRKLLSDVKLLEEENSSLKEKVSVLKDKLTEATDLINNLTEQLFVMNKECNYVKDAIGKIEQEKVKLCVEMEGLRKGIFQKDSNRENIYEEIKTKVHHWKQIAKSKKAEVEALSSENRRLKENLLVVGSKPKSSLENAEINKKTIKELQEKLIEASNEINISANLIQTLKTENVKLKSIIEEVPDTSVSEFKNQSDEGKARAIINKLKRKVKSLSMELKAAEEIITSREKELSEITSQLQLLRSEEGLNSLVDGFKTKKRQIKLKDEEIKTLVHDVNKLNELVDVLQLENESLRQTLNIQPDETVETTGILKNYYELQNTNSKLYKQLKELENEVIDLKLNNRDLSLESLKMEKLLNVSGHTEEIQPNIEQSEHSGATTEYVKAYKSSTTLNTDFDMQALIEENKGLRVGLQEILNFLKDNSKTSSGILTLECPTLETILLSMEARNSAGWFSPHMTTIMELRAALGGKDALLTALHEAKKETFDVMSQLSIETKKNASLEEKLALIKKTYEREKEVTDISELPNNQDCFEFGSWMTEMEQKDIDVNDANQIENYIHKGNQLYEIHLKKGLEYFHNKFGELFNRITSITVEATDNLNKWTIQEEQYKAEIENLRSQLHDEEESSDNSPGLMPTNNVNVLERKCSYLEEIYTHIRTMNENMRNEILESRHNNMLMSSDYENQIQKLMLSVANLTDKLRCSVPLELFWTQNATLNDVTSKYRGLIENKLDKSVDLFHRLEQYKCDIMSSILNTNKSDSEHSTHGANSVEHEIEKKEIELLCSEIEHKTKQIEILNRKNVELQESQAKFIDRTLSALTEQEIDLMKDQLNKLARENVILKEQYQHTRSQLEIALIQLQDKQQRNMASDIEINMLRHQILDLQSEGDNKAIIARLSGEILVAHLQASENHKSIYRLNEALLKEKELRTETEEMLRIREKIFGVYAMRYESKFRHLYEAMQILRQQYQGALPLISVENYLNNLEDLHRKYHAVDEKLSELEDLRSNLITKHSVFDQIFEVSKNKCISEEPCSHKLKYLMIKSSNSREFDHVSNKLKTLENSREDLIRHCNNLEKTLVLVNQGFGKGELKMGLQEKRDLNHLKLEDVLSEDESSNSRRSETVTLTKPKILTEINKPSHTGVITNTKPSTVNTASSPIRNIKLMETTDTFVQTLTEVETKHAFAQTFIINNIHEELKNDILNLKKDYATTSEELSVVQLQVFQRGEEINILNNEKEEISRQLQKIKDLNLQKDSLNERLRLTIDELQKELNELKISQTTVINKTKESFNEEKKQLLVSLKQLEIDKNNVVEEYKKIFYDEREEYSKSVKELNFKIMELQSKLDRHDSESSVNSGETLKEVITKYTMKVAEFEDKCFKLQSELDDCKSELATYQSEAERWKDLASERLNKMEQLNIQLEERHCQEVDSYKAENQHWLTKLSDMQREHVELRSRLTEQKTIYIKQLGDKDTQIEQLRSVINSLKTQIMNMQTLISVNDPSFDLSAIVEVDEATDALSQQSDQLELKFESSIDLHDIQDNVVKFPASSTSIWHEPIIERLRQEKQLASKQNLILRRQIKVLAARERRARLDAQNLKNQVFRISTTGNKVATAETAALQNKVASLQAQLTSARRDTNSSVAIWDKWKRAQQIADRWQARYEDKSQEVLKIEANLNMAKSAVSRLEKEKRVLLCRLADFKSESHLPTLEKQDRELQEKVHHKESEYLNAVALPVSTQALLDRVEAQQRRIAALEVAEKGNEFLVSEYEKSLAQITSLKGQVLKLESTLLESQIRTPMKSATEAQPELDYWKSYCDMLKEENVQLTQKINALETAPTTAHQHRVSDLEQTVLTLRGLVSKLQAEQKAGVSHKKVDSRPSSGRSVSEKGRAQLESSRTEISNLKRTIHDKDLLLEKSKEMLKMAAEREEELLRENAYLQRQIEEFTRARGGFLSA